jgi:hypothetical protein
MGGFCAITVGASGCTEGAEGCGATLATAFGTAVAAGLTTARGPVAT